MAAPHGKFRLKDLTTMQHLPSSFPSSSPEADINCDLRKVNPLDFPRDPAPLVPLVNTAAYATEAYNLGSDARNDNVPLDENPYNPYHCRHCEHVDWSRGWADADREREGEDDANPDRAESARYFSRTLGIPVGAVYQLRSFRNMDAAAMRKLVERERTRALTDGSL